MAHSGRVRPAQCSHAINTLDASELGGLPLHRCKSAMHGRFIYFWKQKMVPIVTAMKTGLKPLLHLLNVQVCNCPTWFGLTSALVPCVDGSKPKVPTRETCLCHSLHANLVCTQDYLGSGGRPHPPGCIWACARISLQHGNSGVGQKNMVPYRPLSRGKPCDHPWAER